MENGPLPLVGTAPNTGLFRAPCDHSVNPSCVPARVVVKSSLPSLEVSMPWNCPAWPVKTWTEPAGVTWMTWPFPVVGKVERDALQAPLTEVRSKAIALAAGRLRPLRVATLGATQVAGGATQDPWEQTASTGHTVPHEPQCAESV